MNIFCLLRIVVGGVLAVSGFEKLVSPYQNFLYVIQAYAFLPPGIEYLVARGLPWVEFFTGVFAVLGLWTKESLIASAVLFFGFIAVVSQALLRHLPIEECGCFGELLSLPPRLVLAMDACLLVAALFLIKNAEKSRRCGLDLCFDQGK